MIYTFIQYIQDVCAEVLQNLSEDNIINQWFGKFNGADQPMTILKGPDTQEIKQIFRSEPKKYAGQTFVNSFCFFRRQDKKFSNKDWFFTIEIDSYDVNDYGEIMQTDDDHRTLTINYSQDEFLLNFHNIELDLNLIVDDVRQKKLENPPMSYFTYTEWEAQNTESEKFKILKLMNRHIALNTTSLAIIKDVSNIKKLPMTKKLKLALEREKIKTPIKKKIIKDTINYDKIFKDAEQIILNAEMIIKSVSGLKSIINPNADQIMSDADMIIKSVSELKPIKLKLEPVQPAQTTQPTRPKGFLQLKPQIRRPLEISFNMPVFKKSTEPTEQTEPTRQTINMEIPKISRMKLLEMSFNMPPSKTELIKTEEDFEKYCKDAYDMLNNKIDEIKTLKDEWKVKADAMARRKLDGTDQPSKVNINELGVSPSKLYCHLSSYALNIYLGGKKNGFNLGSTCCFSYGILRQMVLKKIPDAVMSLVANAFD